MKILTEKLETVFVMCQESAWQQGKREWGVSGKYGSASAVFECDLSTNQSVSCPVLTTLSLQTKHLRFGLETFRRAYLST